jgi:hypothetical protein
MNALYLERMAMLRFLREKKEDFLDLIAGLFVVLVLGVLVEQAQQAQRDADAELDAELAEFFEAWPR